MTCWGGKKWKVWNGDKATGYLREGIEYVGEKRWSGEGKEAGANLDP